MRLFDPDDFGDQPYVGGLNQMGHVILGACLVGIASIFLLPSEAVAVAALGVFTWELYQLNHRGALRRDFLFDLIYWIAGIGGWAWLIQSGAVGGYAVIAPALPVAAWFLEFLRLSGRGSPK